MAPVLFVLDATRPSSLPRNLPQSCPSFFWSRKCQGVDVGVGSVKMRLKMQAIGCCFEQSVGVAPEMERRHALPNETNIDYIGRVNTRTWACRRETDGISYPMGHLQFRSAAMCLKHGLQALCDSDNPYCLDYPAVESLSSNVYNRLLAQFGQTCPA